MKIQPNYINPNYSQPAFKASFDLQDGETKNNLKELTRYKKGGPDFVYELMMKLSMIQSDDKLTVHRKNSAKTNILHTYTVTNTRTTKSIEFDTDESDWGTKMSDILNYRHNRQPDNNAAYLLRMNILSNLEVLFGKNSIPKGKKINFDTFNFFSKELNLEEMYNKITQKNAEISRVKSKANDKINALNKEIDNLDDDIAEKKAAYVRSQIDAIA